MIYRDDASGLLYRGGTRAETLAYLRRNGYTNIRLTRVGSDGGPYRRPRRLRPAFAFDRAALRDAEALLGIRLPVRYRYSVERGQNGVCLTYEGRHEVAIRDRLTPERATSTLWHELQHAADHEAQIETLGFDGFCEALSAVNRSHAYLRRPHEVRARALAALMADVPLALDVPKKK